MTFLANNNGKPARSVAFMAIATWVIVQVVGPALLERGFDIGGEYQVAAIGVAMYALERGYRYARGYSWFSALDPWTGEP